MITIRNKKEKKTYKYQETPGHTVLVFREYLLQCLCLLLPLVLSLFTGCERQEISITTEPSGAEVFINKTFAGETPLVLSKENSNITIFTQKRKNIVLEIRREFFLPVSTEISFSQISEENLHFTLEISRNVLQNYDGIFQKRYELSAEDIESRNPHELELLRFELYAKYGKIFSEPVISAFFQKKLWYKENPYFDESFLDEIDRKNKILISNRLLTLSRENVSPIGIGKPSENDIKLKETILHNVEYTYDSGEKVISSFDDTWRDSCTLVFSDAERVIWYDDSNYFGTHYAATDVHLEWHWEVYRGKVYIWDMNDDASGYIVFIFNLDHQKKKIVSIPDIDGNIW
jgi:hypothetical protein